MLLSDQKEALNFLVRNLQAKPEALKVTWEEISNFVENCPNAYQILADALDVKQHQLKFGIEQGSVKRSEMLAALSLFYREI